MTATPHCKEAAQWFRDRRISLAALTGQDWRAFRAIAHCWELYAAADEIGARGALAAIRALLLALQPQCHVFARELIAFSMNWDDRDRLWPMVSDQIIASLPHETEAVRKRHTTKS